MGTGAPEEYCSVLEVMQAWTMAFRSQISDVRLKCGDIYPENKKEIGEKEKKKQNLSPGTFTQWKLQALGCSSTKCPRTGGAPLP